MRSSCEAVAIKSLFSLLLRSKALLSAFANKLLIRNVERNERFSTLPKFFPGLDISLQAKFMIAHGVCEKGV